MALTTIPMPADVNDIYAFDGKSYGNEATCEVQSSAIYLGWVVSVSSNVVLSLFYVLTIRYEMEDVTFKKKILPTALLLSLAVAIGATTLVHLSGLFNPRPFEPYCFVGAYPMDCKRDEANEIYACERGGARSSKKFYNATTILSAFLVFSFIIVISSMCLVVRTVFRREQFFFKHSKSEGTAADHHRDQDNETDEAQHATTRLPNHHVSFEEFKQTKVIVYQALMYIGAFIVTWLWVLMLVFVRGEGSETYYSIVDRLKVFFQPLQGFFNAWIFLWHKAYLLRRSDRNLTFFEAMRKAIVSPYEVPEMLIENTTLLLVNDEHEEDKEDVEAGDPASSFDLHSKETPSFDLSKALSKSTNICDVVEGVDYDRTKTAEKSPYRFYQYPTSETSN